MLGSDLRYAWRSLSHQKLGTGLVIGMLALGIGAIVAVFSLINGLFLRPFPFPEPDRLVYINQTAPKWNLEQTGVSYADFVVWHRDQQALDAIAHQKLAARRMPVARRRVAARADEREKEAKDDRPGQQPR